MKLTLVTFAAFVIPFPMSGSSQDTQKEESKNCAGAEYTFFQPCVRDVRDSYVNRERPTTSTLVVVKQLFRKEFLIEVDAIAVVKD